MHKYTGWLGYGRYARVVATVRLHRTPDSQPVLEIYEEEDIQYNDKIAKILYD